MYPWLVITTLALCSQCEEFPRPFETSFFYNNTVPAGCPESFDVRNNKCPQAGDDLNNYTCRTIEEEYTCQLGVVATTSNEACPLGYKITELKKRFVQFRDKASELERNNVTVCEYNVSKVFPVVSNACARALGACTAEKIARCEDLEKGAKCFGRAMANVICRRPNDTVLVAMMDLQISVEAALEVSVLSEACSLAGVVRAEFNHVTGGGDYDVAGEGGLAKLASVTKSSGSGVEGLPPFPLFLVMVFGVMMTG